MADTLTVRTLERIEDPQRGGAFIKAGIVIELPRKLAKRLIAQGRVEQVKK